VLIPNHAVGLILEKGFTFEHQPTNSLLKQLPRLSIPDKASQLHSCLLKQSLLRNFLQANDEQDGLLKGCRYFCLCGSFVALHFDASSSAQSRRKLGAIRVFHQRAAKKRAPGLFNALGYKEFGIHSLNSLMIKFLDQLSVGF
jgi:hypothetical protein